MYRGNGVRKLTVKLLGFIGVMLYLLFLQSGCAKPSEGKLTVSRPSFSPDNSNLLFTHCDPKKRCTLGIYDLTSRRLTLFNPPNNEHWLVGRYSPSGREIVFVVNKPGEIVRQVATVNTDGSNYRVLTKTPIFKTHPSYSPDEKKIIYVGAKYVRTEGKTPVADLDLFTVSRDGLNGVALTNFNFFLMDPPAFLPDGEHVIFSGEYPNRSTAYKDQFDENNIFIMTAREQKLQPALSRGNHSNNPSVSKDGSKILFESRSNDLDGGGNAYHYDMFLKTDTGITRLTRLQSIVRESSIAEDGSRAVFIRQVVDTNMNINSDELMTIQTDGSEPQTIVIPETYSHIDVHFSKVN
jgi:Tol biopolymer transport system component